MPTDKLFYEYATHFPNAMAKFVRAEADDYEAKSVTFKETEKRADVFLIGRSGQNVVLVEPQGYDNEELFYDMVKKIMYYCTHYKYRGKLDATAIFLDESHYRAASIFEQQFSRGSMLRFAPRVFVLGRTNVEKISQFNDVHLAPLYPLCNISDEEIRQHAPAWAGLIKESPELAEDERKSLLGFLAGAISHRIKTLSFEELNVLFGGFAMEDSPIVQQILEKKKPQWIEQGIEQGIQKVILTLIVARFGTVPADIAERLRMIRDPDLLERIATMLLTIQSIDELKKLIN